MSLPDSSAPHARPLAPLLFLWVALCVGLGLAGGLATSAGVRDWYPALAKPAWTPPSWLFGPVWTALYVAMGVAAARLHAVSGSLRASRGALPLFLLQLAVNASWSWIFFGLRQPGLGFAWLLALVVLLAATLARAARVDRLAALLLLPYLAWVLFATALNYAIWLGNR